MYQINNLYTLNLHKIICQLYLNKAGKKNRINNNYIKIFYSIKFMEMKFCLIL